jgi:hypothetical protein
MLPYADPGLLTTIAMYAPRVTVASAVSCEQNHTLSSVLRITCVVSVVVPHKVPVGYPVAPSTVSARTLTVAPVVTVPVPKHHFRMSPAFGARKTHAHFPFAAVMEHQLVLRASAEFVYIGISDGNTNPNFTAPI